MDALRQERLGELFERALERPLGAREAFLDDACRDDPELMLWVMYHKDGSEGSDERPPQDAVGHLVFEVP